jgi:hypothetical protein
MRFVRTIFSLLLTVMFLVSFTGLRLLIHHCSGCDTSNILFASESVSCCSVESPSKDPNSNSIEGLSCCTESVSTTCGIRSERGCCDVEMIYLVEGYQGLLHKPTEKPEISIHYNLSDIPTDIFDQCISSHSYCETPLIDPPPRLVGKAFILYTHHIKIA